MSERYPPLSVEVLKQIAKSGSAYRNEVKAMALELIECRKPDESVVESVYAKYSKYLNLTP